jgi:hypothetical protein
VQVEDTPIWSSDFVPQLVRVSQGDWNQCELTDDYKSIIQQGTTIETKLGEMTIKVPSSAPPPQQSNGSLLQGLIVSGLMIYCGVCLLDLHVTFTN